MTHSNNSAGISASLCFSRTQTACFGHILCLLSCGCLCRQTLKHDFGSLIFIHTRNVRNHTLKIPHPCSMFLILLFFQPFDDPARLWVLAAVASALKSPRQRSDVDKTYSRSAPVVSTAPAGVWTSLQSLDSLTSQCLLVP